MPRSLFPVFLLLAACGTTWTVEDLDGDGVSPADGDCWDSVESPPNSKLTGADIHPDAPETWYDGIDQNCDGKDDYDADGDHFVPLDEQVGLATYGIPGSGEDHLGGGDCWDASPELEVPLDKVVVSAEIDLDEAGLAFVQPSADLTFPGAIDTWYDGLDQDCAGNSDFDQDGDGFDAELHRQADGAVGDDCLDGSWRDDGNNPAGSDPVDVNPAGTEVWYDGTDQDCNTNDCDADEDGADADPIAAGYCDDIDCNDDDASAVPNDSAEVYYNGQDDNCDNTDGDGDMDGDGYWSAEYLTLTTPDATVQVPAAYDDCWDDTTSTPASMVPANGASALTAAEVNPAAADRPYDMVPQDCETDANGDGLDDDRDWDGDGYASEVNGAGDDCLDCPLDQAGTAWYLDYCGSETSNPAALDASIVNSGVGLDDPYDGTDANCDEWNDYDQDHDGYVSAEYDILAGSALCGGVACQTGDCDDSLSAIHPGAADTWYSGTDEDCDGRDDFDADEDGYVATGNVGKRTTYVSSSGALPGGDCDDVNDAANPGEANELCGTAFDDDCDGSTNDSNADACIVFYADADNDNYGNAAVHDCLCVVTTTYETTNSTDCDDTDAARSPALTEVCDSLNKDEDCDSLSDNADSSATTASKTTYYLDSDSDGYGSTTSAKYCDLPTGYSAVNTDCDDTDAARSPALTEVCDSANKDEDCDTKSDDSDSSVDATTKSTWYLDGDKDYYLKSSPTSTAKCDRPAGTSTTQYLLSTEATTGTDCDDASFSINPGGQEICDGSNTDEDCDGSADNNDTSALASGKTTYYLDGDSDGYGSTTSAAYCDLPTGYSAVNTDCDDTTATRSPGNTEVCDASNTDEDCDLVADNNDTSASVATKTQYYTDSDGDGYGTTTGAKFCDLPSSGYSALNTDCDDSTATRSPALTEVCDASNKDEDCDLVADNNDSSASAATKSAFYVDADADGYGTTTSAQFCDLPASGYATVNTDCDDTTSTRSPALTEVCDAADKDEDCDLLSDNNDSSASLATKTSYYLDSDGDGYGSSTSAKYCDLPTGYAVLGTDCDDSTATRSPGNNEVCDAANVDEDCDSLADNNDASALASGKTNFYVDADLDGYGSTTVAALCDIASGYSTLNTDCDDTTSTRSPGNTEVCDAANKDEDCDTVADDSDASVNPATKTTYYLDSDSDGAGGSSSTAYCDPPTGYTATSTDCNDSFYSVTTGTVGAGDSDHDGIDDDCDGLVDEGSVGAGDLYINEWMINPTGTGIQWFELKNPGANTLYLDGWKVVLAQNIGGTSTTVSTIYLSVDAAPSISAGGVVLFCEEQASAWATANCDYFYTIAPSWYHDFVTPYITGVSDDTNFTFDVFASGSDTNTLSVGLVDGGTSLTVDFVAYGATFPHFTSGYSMALDATGTAANNNNAGKWAVAASNPTYVDGGTQRGTPGCANASSTCP